MIRSGEITSGDVDQELFELTGDMLFRGVKRGFRLDIQPESARESLLKTLRENVYVFSGFKTYQFLREATDLLIDEQTGTIRPFDEFARLIKSLNEEYNVHFLRSEYNHANASARMAEKWTQITENAETLPLLQYVDAGDARVRASHRRLNKITLPVNHPFWQEYYPPNDWNCRCTVRQLVDGQTTTPQELQDLPELKEMFALNAGTSGVVFPPSHPYYDVARQDEANARNNFGLDIPE